MFFFLDFWFGWISVRSLAGFLPFSLIFFLLCRYQTIISKFLLESNSNHSKWPDFPVFFSGYTCLSHQCKVGTSIIPECFTEFYRVFFPCSLLDVVVKIKKKDQLAGVVNGDHRESMVEFSSFSSEPSKLARKDEPNHTMRFARIISRQPQTALFFLQPKRLQQRRQTARTRAKEKQH